MPDIDRDKLKKLLLVALSSDQSGEIVSAINATRNLLRNAGHDIHWLAATLIGQAGTNRQQQQRPLSEWEKMLTTCCNSGTMLREKEQDFILSLARQRSSRPHWRPSEKQEKWLTDIYKRVIEPPF